MICLQLHHRDDRESPARSDRRGPEPLRPWSLNRSLIAWPSLALEPGLGELVMPTLMREGSGCADPGFGLRCACMRQQRRAHRLQHCKPSCTPIRAGHDTNTRHRRGQDHPKRVSASPHNTTPFHCLLAVLQLPVSSIDPMSVGGRHLHARGRRRRREGALRLRALTHLLEGRGG